MQGMAYLHSKKLSHVHLRSSKCILDRRLNAKVTDFGPKLDDVVYDTFDGSMADMGFDIREPDKCCAEIMEDLEGEDIEALENNKLFGKEEKRVSQGVFFTRTDSRTSVAGAFSSYFLHAPGYIRRDVIGMIWSR